MNRLLSVVAALVLLAGGGPLAAQGTIREPSAQAFELERTGHYAEAAVAYRQLLRDSPVDVTALLGLERVLQAQGRTAEVLPAVHAALAADSSSPLAYAVAARTYATLQQPDSLRWAVERWLRVEPGEEAPYREWARLALQLGDRPMAREALTRGRKQLGRPDALAADLAQLDQLDEDYAGAVSEWVRAVDALPGYRPAARSALLRAPAGARAVVLQGLQAGHSPSVRLLEAEMRAAWGDPVGGFSALQPALAGRVPVAVELLRSYLADLGDAPTPAASRARAMTLEALAARMPAGAEASRLRLDAARAYNRAGDHSAAERLLARVDSAGGDAGPATRIELLLGQGQVEQALAELARAAGKLPAERLDQLRRRAAWAWAVAGHPAAADSLLRPDSTVEGLAVSGRIRLLMGDVAEARRRLQAAGPYAGNRDAATARASLLALLQSVRVDTLAELGRAFLHLEQGDTGTAVKSLERTAGGLAPDQGGADLLLLAGRLARRWGDLGAAERDFRAAAVPGAAAAAPAAELSLAELLLERGRRDEAVAALEHLILTYPESALVPQARRLRDQARGAIPRT